MDQHNTIDYRLLVDNLTTAILLVDSKLNIFYLNSACEALFDISSFRASGQPVLNLLHAHDDSFSTHEALINTLQSGQHYTRREAVINVNFKPIHVDYTVSQLNAGKSHHSLLLIELNPIDRMLKISKEENLVQQHQVARQLVRGVAHEIKNPLAGIRGATQLLARSLNDESYREFTDIIISEVDRLKLLADTMLGRNRPAQLGCEAVDDPIDLGGTLDEGAVFALHWPRLVVVQVAIAQVAEVDQPHARDRGLLRGRFRHLLGDGFKCGLGFCLCIAERARPPWR